MSIAQCTSSTEPTLRSVLCFIGAEGLTLVCSTSLDGTMVPLTYTCSYTDGHVEDCELLDTFPHPWV